MTHDLTQDEKLDFLKAALDEGGAQRTLSDAQLEVFLKMAHDDPGGAAYLGALAKARVDAASLPDGTSVASNRAYWLGIAAAFRPNRGGARHRADGR